MIIEFLFYLAGIIAIMHEVLVIYDPNVHEDILSVESMGIEDRTTPQHLYSICLLLYNIWMLMGIVASRHMYSFLLLFVCSNFPSIVQDARIRKCRSFVNLINLLYLYFMVYDDWQKYFL